MVMTKITSNVLESISNGIKKGNFSNEKGKVLVLLTGSSMDLSSRLNLLLKLKESGVELSLGFSFMGDKLLDTKKIISIIKPIEVFKEEDIVKLPMILGSYSYIICPNITMNTLSKVALGMIDSFVPNLIWTYIYQGRKVYMDFNSVRNYLGDVSKSREIMDITEKYISSVKKMGVIEINEKEFMGKFLLEKSSSELGQININSPSKKKDLITERDILSIPENQKVIGVAKGTVITPLAKDRIRELGINIEIK